MGNNFNDRAPKSRPTRNTDNHHHNTTHLIDLREDTGNKTNLFTHQKELGIVKWIEVMLNTTMILVMVTINTWKIKLFMKMKIVRQRKISTSTKKIFLIELSIKTLM